ncbi:MAG: hypothetical protein HY854_18720 [Burkholderiales bacterium]|nr:hypothetical protein [Burkholderiales bacterium]
MAAPSISVHFSGSVSAPNYADFTEDTLTLYAAGTFDLFDSDVSDDVTAWILSAVIAGDNTGPALTAGDFGTWLDLPTATVTHPADGTPDTLQWFFSADLAGYTDQIGSLSEGESINLIYTIAVSDGAFTVGDQINVTITINGANDLPVWSVESGDLDFAAVSENGSVSDTLTLRDLDLNDSVDIAVGGVFLSTTTNAIADDGWLSFTDSTSLTADYGTSSNVGWTFDAGTAFDYLAEGESAVVIYYLVAEDRYSGIVTTTLSISVTGENDAPTLTPATHTVSDSAVYDTFTDVTGVLATTDPDISDVHTYSVAGSAPDIGDWVTVSGAYGDLYLDTVTGAYRYDPDEAAVNALGPAAAPSDVFSITVSDSIATDTENLTFTLDGANDTPVGGVTVVANTLYLTQHQLVASHNITDAEGYTTVTYSFIRDDLVVVQTGASNTYTLSYPNGDAGHTFTVRVTYTDGGGTTENVTSAATQLVGAWRIGTAGNDSLEGSIGNDSLEGLAGHDTLNGLAGDDTMVGSTGNDTYYVDTTGDVIDETGPLTDTRDHIISSIDYTLAGAAANIEYLTLTGVTAVNGIGNNFNNQIAGNSINNSLVGAGGNDTIDGGAGDDTMDGGDGNDTYLVDSTNDVIIDSSGTLDQVVATATYSIASNAGIERLTLMGTGTIDGTGNAGNNVLTGNSGANSLAGGAGNDTMYGLGGNDTLVGDSGNDSMLGLTGDDTYYVTELLDKVVEATGQGNDTIITTVTYTMPVYVETMVMLAGAVNGTGNAQANTITGNSSANAIKGMAGNDTLYGGGGADSLTGGAGVDVLQGDAGADWYIYALVSESPNLVGQRDTIVLVLADGDKINLSAIDANVTLTGNQPFTWKGTAAFDTNAAGQLRYDDVAGILYGSNDADTIAEFAIIIGAGHNAASLLAAITL